MENRIDESWFGIFIACVIISGSIYFIITIHFFPAIFSAIAGILGLVISIKHGWRREQNQRKSSTKTHISDVPDIVE